MNWEKKDGNPANALSRSQLRSDGLLRYRRLICKSKIKNMALSIQYELVSLHTRPVHCLALERQENQYLLSGGLDGQVSMYDLNEVGSDDRESKRTRIKNIAIAYNSIQTSNGVSAQSGPALSIAISSINWYPKDSGIFATTDFDGNLNIWDTNEFTIVGNFKLRSKIYNAKFNGDGSLIAVALDDHSIR
jgi:DNA excision repair protein ERCC-8